MSRERLCQRVALFCTGPVTGEALSRKELQYENMCDGSEFLERCKDFLLTLARNFFIHPLLHPTTLPPTYSPTPPCMRPSSYNLSEPQVTHP